MCDLISKKSKRRSKASKREWASEGTPEILGYFFIR